MAYHSPLRRTLAALCFRRNFFSRSSSYSSTSLSRLISNPNNRFASALPSRLRPGSAATPVQFTTSGPDSEPLEDEDGGASGSDSWPPRHGDGEETVVIEGCDFEHWLVIMSFPEVPKPSEEEMVNTYVSTLAKVVGSEEEAKKKIYSVSTTTYTGFGALLSRDLSKTLKGLPGVDWVLPDSYIDVPSKDYGGDLFVDGKVIPRPEYRFQGRPEEEEPLDSGVYDDEYFNVEDFKQEIEDVPDELLERLRITGKTKKTEMSLRTKTLEGTEDLEGNEEETRKLFDRVKERMEAISEEAMENKTEESEGTKASKGLNQVFANLRGKLKSAKKEPVPSTNEDSDWPDCDDYHVGNTEDPNKPLPDLNNVKEAMKALRRDPMESRKDDNLDLPVEETEGLKGHFPVLDRLRENAECEERANVTQDQ